MTGMKHKLRVLLLIHTALICGCHCGYDCIRDCACEKRDGIIIADCHGINATEVPLPENEYPIGIFYLQYNRITRLKMGDFFLYNNLKELYIQGNRMDTIDPGAFDGLENLQKLDISQNMLTKIPEKELKKLANLNWLSVSMNGLRKIPEGIANFSKLQNLDLSNNLFISDIPPGSLAASLTRLDMHYTSIKLFKKSSFDKLADLKTLLLSDNGAASSVRFESQAFDGLTSLEYLDLSRSYCKDLPVDSFQSLANLTTLLLNNCWLEKPPIFAKPPKTGSEAPLGRKRRSDTEDETTATAGAMGTTDMTSPKTQQTTTSTPTTAQMSTAPPPGDTWYNPKLDVLDLSNNPKLDTPALKIRFPASLSELRLANTLMPTISDDTFSETTQIQKLDLCNSRIKSISTNAFLGFLNLSEIGLSGNPLKSIPRLPAALLRLNLSETGITGLTKTMLDGLNNVISADINGGNIEWVEDGAFESMTSLRTLDLSDNKVDTLTAQSLNIGTFNHSVVMKGLVPTPQTRKRFADVGKQSSLTDLNLSGNLLRDIERGAFATHVSLKKLDLQSNFLPFLQPGVFAGLRSLTVLDVSKNVLLTIVPNTFEELTSLEVLDLSQNELEDIRESTFLGLSALKRLNLGGNRIVLFHPFTTATLEYVDISQNNLTVFPKFRGSALREIVAAGNVIEKFAPSDLDGIPNLQNLDIGGCDITDFNYNVFHGTPSLRYLDLRGNHITKFPDVPLPSLEVLSLADNEIRTVDTELDEIAPKIQRLQLHDNKVSYLDPQIFSDSQVREVDLTGNNLQCDCDLVPFVQWIMSNKASGAVDIMDAEAYLCHGPPGLYGTPVLTAVCGLNCDKPQPRNTKRLLAIGTAAALFVIVLTLVAWFFLILRPSRRARNVRNRNGQARTANPGGTPDKKWWRRMDKNNAKDRRERVLSDDDRKGLVDPPENEVSLPTSPI